MIPIVYPTSLWGAALGRLRRRPRVEVIVGDITHQHVDAIVNAAKPSLLGGGGVDGAIHRAGGPAILRECRMLRTMVMPEGLPAGQAVATGAGDLPAEMVIHTVGPIYSSFKDQGREDQEHILRSCYTESLAVAANRGARTVAFPLIGAGAYGWSRRDAVRAALDALTAARTPIRLARLVVFDTEAYRIAEQYLEDIS